MKFNLRRLNNGDVFKMIKIISKCGISQVKECIMLAASASEKMK